MDADRRDSPRSPQRLVKVGPAVDNHFMGRLETIQFEATPEFRRRVELEAARLHMSLSAYFAYLEERARLGAETGRFDRHVDEVFGKHGDLMRRLAK